MQTNKPDECPLLGHFLRKSVVYRATVSCTNDNKPNETYVDLTASTFKTRLTNHKNSFKYRRKKHSTGTELSNYIWQLNVYFNIEWKILKQAKSYNNISYRCNSCLWEKYFIICRSSMASLNKRNM